MPVKAVKFTDLFGGTQRRKRKRLLLMGPGTVARRRQVTRLRTRVKVTPLASRIWYHHHAVARRAVAGWRELMAEFRPLGPQHTCLGHQCTPGCPAWQPCTVHQWIVGEHGGWVCAHCGVVRVESESDGLGFAVGMLALLIAAVVLVLAVVGMARPYATP